jgi:hypothetical protein
MQKNKKALDEKIERYLKDLFAGVGQSQQLFDLKEELSTNLKEKIADYQSRGLADEQAFKEAVISMGDLSGGRSASWDRIRPNNRFIPRWQTGFPPPAP